MAFRPDYLTYTHTVVNVGAVSTALLAANTAGLKYVLIENVSNQVVWIKVGAAAVLLEGIGLPAVDASSNPQGAYELSGGTGNLSLEAINGICAGGGKNVTVTVGV